MRAVLATTAALASLHFTKSAAVVNVVLQSAAEVLSRPAVAALALTS